MGQLITVAGFDPTGGAGIVRDLLTFFEIGCEGRAVISAITGQNSKGEFFECFPLPSQTLIKQLDSIESDGEISHIKVGMLGNKENVNALSLWINKIFFRIKALVIDPLIRSSKGFFLTDDKDLSVLKEKLIPICSLLTPNIYEAEVLSKKKIKTMDDMVTAGRIILDMGSKAVLIKGGHLSSKPVDILMNNDELIEYHGERISSELHGTGCILSSAIISFLYLDYSLKDACREGKRFVERKILCAH